MEEIKNEKEKVVKDKCMSNEDIVNDILMCEKNISDNYSIAVNEMSNKQLYKVVMSILTDSKNAARELYNLAFEKGWYSVKAASETEITKAHTEYSSKVEELG